MHTLGVICARAKSQRVPNKAFQVVGDLTLLDRTLQAARSSKWLDGLVIASDDPRCGDRPELWIKLPAAVVDGPIVGTLNYVLDNAFIQPDLVVTLQSCIPFRTGRHIDDAIDLLERSALDSVQTVVNVGWDHAPLYKPNGAVYVTQRALIRDGRLWGARHGMLLMAREESINIDTEWDLQLARSLA